MGIVLVSDWLRAQACCRAGCVLRRAAGLAACLGVLPGWLRAQASEARAMVARARRTAGTGAAGSTSVRNS